jgi:rare lipoprotein A
VLRSCIVLKFILNVCILHQIGCAHHARGAALPVPAGALRAQEPEPSLRTAPTVPVSKPDAAPFQSGEASYYGEKFRGRKTASGEPFDPSALTAAHRTLPFGTWVLVSRTDVSRSVRVRITDRGPFKAGRVIDLSTRAAEDLDMIRAGVAAVEIRVVSGP